MVCIRPFGSSGPAADRRAHHLTLFHASGEGSFTPIGLGWELFPERAPLQVGSEIGYFDAGWNAAAATLAACYDRLRSGNAQRIDISVQESILTLNRVRMNASNNEHIGIGREKSRLGILGMLRCADGWVELMAVRDEHWDRLLELPEGGHFRDERFNTSEARARNMDALGEALAAWCAAQSKSEVARVISAIGAAAAVFAEPPDLAASEQLAARGFFRDVDDGSGGTLRLPGPPYTLSRTPITLGPVPKLGSSQGFVPRRGRPQPRSDLQPGRLLEGVRVLDFTWAAAGPYATLLLGFLGADVVKVESKRRLDPGRHGFIGRHDGTEHSPVFNELCLNKRSLQIDLKTPEGIAIAKRLTAWADVVADNFRPGVMERLGLAPATLLAADPQLVVASSSANGSTGPDATHAGYAMIFAARGGLSSQTGYPDGPPTEINEPMDLRSGAVFAVAILAALVHRATTGEGQHIDMSSCEVAIASAPDGLLAHLVDAPWTLRLGNGHRTMAPHDVYPCLDGEWVAIAVDTAAEWAALCRVLDRDEWVHRYDSLLARQAAAATIDTAIARFTTARTAGEAAAMLQRAGVPAEPVMTFAALSDDPHLAARSMQVDVEHPVLGLQRVIDAPWHFSDPVRSVLRPGPLLGADNAALLETLDDLPQLTPERAAQIFV